MKWELVKEDVQTVGVHLVCAVLGIACIGAMITVEIAHQGWVFLARKLQRP